MEAKKEKKYMSDIHLEDYTEQYETGFATVDTMIFEGGRREELLNGGWHYAVDQYDTCLRQKWYKERYRDEKGFTVPIDYSFDEWPVMQLPCSWNTIDPMYLLYEGSMVFTRKFSYIAEREETVFLKVGAALVLLAGVSMWIAARFDWIALQAHPLARMGALALVMIVCGIVYFGALFAMGFRIRDFRRIAS